MKKGIIITLILALLIGALVWFFTRPATGDKLAEKLAPSLKTIHFQVTDIESDHLKLIAHATLENKAPVGLHLDKMTNVFSIEGQEVARTTYDQPVDLEANDTSSISIPVTLKQDLIAAILKKKRNKGHDSITYHLKTCLFGTALPSEGLCIERSKHMVLPMIPEVGLVDVDLQKLRLSNTKVGISLWMYHRYAFDIKLSNLQYEFNLAQQKALKGSMPGIVDIPSGDTTTITVPVQLNLKELSKSVATLIQKGDSTPYTLKLTANIVSESELFKDGKIVLKASGTKGDLEKLAKNK